MSAPAVLLTGAGKRYDIVSCFSHLTRTIVADPAGHTSEDRVVRRGRRPGGHEAVESHQHRYTSQPAMTPRVSSRKGAPRWTRFHPSPP